MSETLRLIDLTRFNTLHLQAKAKHYIVLNSLDSLGSIHDSLASYPKFFILGGGSNLVLPETYEGLVIHNRLKGIQAAGFNHDYSLVTAMGGETWDDFVAYCIKNGHYGLENLSLIPGTVGASPIQNIGAYGVEVKDFIDHVNVYDWKKGKLLTFSNARCKFGYRTSFFKNKSRYLVISVSFKLPKAPKLNISYGDVAKYLSEIANPTPTDLRNIIIRIRSSKLPNPAEIGNAGSFFHNPVITKKKAEKLLGQYPELPVFAICGHACPARPALAKVKISAGWLIDNLGLKGYRQGNVGVYTKQALVLVNYGKATQAELLEFASWIQQKVAEVYRIKLNIEPIILC